jgi:SAM-dependent methyltransferase
MNAFLRRMRHQFRLLEFRFRNLGKDVFTCPVCGYSGPFRDLSAETGLRKHAECPSCGAKERHRIQYVAFLRLKQAVDTKSMSLLHFAPEAFFRQIFQQNFADYVTADIAMKNVDHQVDLRKLPFSDHSFDVVYASHVLEHIDDDRSALKEIRRILKPNGIAILPVPIVADRTVEYPCPNPHESGLFRNDRAGHICVV